MKLTVNKLLKSLANFEEEAFKAGYCGAHLELSFDGSCCLVVDGAIKEAKTWSLGINTFDSIEALVAFCEAEPFKRYVILAEQDSDWYNPGVRMARLSIARTSESPKTEIPEKSANKKNRPRPSST